MPTAQPGPVEIKGQTKQRCGDIGQNMVCAGIYLINSKKVYNIIAVK
jgi:hypothetical protein